MKKKNFVMSLIGVVALVTGLSVTNAYGSEMCDTHRVIAENAMKLRIKGVSEENVGAMMETQIGKIIVAMAYSYDMSSNKSKLTTDFGDYVADACEGVVRRSRGGVAI